MGANISKQLVGSDSMNHVDEVIEQLRQTMPPVFAGTELNHYTGNAFQWRTLQNAKCSGEVPSSVFIKSGSKKLLVVRDPFLEYWRSKLSRG